MASLLRRHPFLALGVLGLLLMLLWSLAGLPTEGHPLAEPVFGLWVLLLRPFSLVATWIDPMTGHWPEALDIVVTLVLGLISYLLLDALVRRIRWRASGRRVRARA
jgi:ABC-type Na+ efflux pump permease subunit